MKFAEIAVDSPIGHGRTFSYEIPEQMSLAIGHLVLVPFGTQILQGIVFSLTEFPSVDNTKFIIEISDFEPLLDEDRLKLAEWLSKYYLCTLFEATALMMPPGIREHEAIWVYWNDLFEGEITDIELSDYQQNILIYVQSRKKVRLSKVISHFGYNARTAITHLVTLGILYRETIQKKAMVSPLFLETLVLSESGRKALNTNELNSAFRQKDLLGQMVFLQRSVKASEIRKKFGYAVVKALLDKGFLLSEKERFYRDPLKSYQYDDIKFRDIELTKEQTDATNMINSMIENTDLNPRAILIHGVTGSGKTEVYLEAVKKCVNEGKRAIVLVPEIALTSQTIERFSANFKDEIAVMHSGLSLGERFDQWYKIRESNYKVVIGSRTALFSPQPDLGLIVIDEEHEWTYKQSDMSPRYHARDTAMQLAGITKCVVVLGSASPDTQSFFRANNARYKFVQLHNRYLNNPGTDYTSDKRGLAEVEIVDMRKELHDANRGMFSRKLQASISDTLHNGNQVILFLNRRGSASFFQCRSCGHVLKCTSCDVSMTYHKVDDKLICHYCNKRVNIPENCSKCTANDFGYYGIGTQSVENEVNDLFPFARSIRWDSDSYTTPSQYAEVLEKFRSGDANVLIGTQVLAKGHHLPGVTLVGVISADVGLSIPDFRSAERSFQLLCQVSGRSGRGNKKGKVIIQTYQPDHYAITSAAAQDYQKFFDIESEYRKKFAYPPYSKMIKLSCHNTNNIIAEKESIKMSVKLKTAQHHWGLEDIDIIGPLPGFPIKIRGHYRWQIILRGSNPRLLLDKIYLRSTQNTYGRIPKGWIIDVDPLFT